MTETANIPELMQTIGDRARKASKVLSHAESSVKNLSLVAAAEALRASKKELIAANQKDIAFGKAKNLSSAMIDRLELNDERIDAIAQALIDISALPDPVGQTIAEWDRPNGLKISRVRVPLGVIGVIYESRPNVTADAAALCLKAGNAVVLRGGSESLHSNTFIHKCLVSGFADLGLPEHSVQLVPTRDRAAVGEMLRMPNFIDVIIPRGGRSLVERIQNESRVPVFAHLEGICHIYVDGSADLKKAVRIALNAKMRRTGTCGAAETMLIDQRMEKHVPALIAPLLDAGCEIRGDETVMAADRRVKPVTDKDWDTEYLDAILSVKMVNGVAAAAAHISVHSSGHTESIIAEDDIAAEFFLDTVDSAIVLHNASTQFADGGEFGMGAEIGIATGRIHARGPVGLEQLTTFKYQVRGDGQIRP